MTVQDIIDTVLAAIPEEIPNTVDTLKSGNPSTEVTGIVTTFLATFDVLKQAHQLGANLIITHEPTYYNHRDETDWLADDPVFQAKKDYIEQSGLCIWRFHDYWHRRVPDGILTGMANALGWSEYQSAPGSKRFNIPELSFQDLVQDIKTKLGVSAVRVAGDPGMVCRTIVHLAGTTPGQSQVRALSDGADVVIVGESNEWETCEYVRDAAALGISKGVIVVGHGHSEDGGMLYLVDWLLQRIGNDVPIYHLPVVDPFRFV